MNTKTIAIVVGVIVVAVGGYLLMGKEAAAPLPGDVVSEPKTTFGSLSDLVGGESIYCTFASDEDGMKSDGEFWHANGQYRVEAVSQSEEGNFETYIIHDGSDMHIWSDTPEGLFAITMSAEDDNVVDNLENGTADTGPDMKAEVEYECSGWEPDSSRFVPPAGIEFMDLDAMMKDLPTFAQ